MWYNCKALAPIKVHSVLLVLEAVSSEDALWHMSVFGLRYST